MLRPRSYHDRRPRSTVEYSAFTPSRWGFFPAILRYLQRLELPQRLRSVTIPAAPNAHFRPVDKLRTLVTLFITALARISHIDRTLAGETARPRFLGRDRFPSSDTLYNLLGTLTTWHVNQMDPLHRTYLGQQARFDQGTVIADLDLSVPSTAGRKRPGATPGYNPKHKGRACYQGAVAFAAVLNDLVSQHLGFLTKAGTKLVSIPTLLERTRSEPWPSYDEETRLGRWNRVRWLDDFRTPVTAVRVQCRRRIKRRQPGRGEGKTRVFPYALATDQQHWTTAKIFETSKARWAVENFFKESHQSFSSGKLPSRKFRGNQFFLALLSGVYNLMQFFKRDCLPRVYRGVSFATVRRHFLEPAVVIEERSEVEIHLIFNEDYPLQREANLMLRKALAA